MRRFIKRILTPLILLVLVACAAGWYWVRRDGGPEEYRTAEVTRGELVYTIGATGTVEPEEVVDVGAQVTAQILSFGTDAGGRPVDYGSSVEEGMVLAKLDDAVYAASLTEAQAQLAQAKAGVLRAKADLDSAKAKLYAAERDWGRAERIGAGDALAQTSYDNYKSMYEQSQANVGVNEAAVAVAEASVDQAKSAVQRAERNLGFTVIKSPVKGTVIDRRVNIGQTVSSNLSVASLFLIAKDLRRMQVWVAVNEADIGQVRVGQPVTFTADAFPGETFRGEVSKIRLNASMTQNVVTYTVEVTTDNSDGRLLPYLTANVQFEVTRKADVLRVPNAALRWAPAAKAGSGGGKGSKAGRREGGRSDGAKSAGGGPPGEAPAAGGPRRGTVWVRDSEGVRPVEVVVGLSDGTHTEISGGELTEGAEVVTGEAQPPAAAAGAGGSTNPFLPKMPSRRGGRFGG